MATIEEYLNLIKNAVYGKDVRQAIHDGIELCYQDSSSGIDIEARPDLAGLQSFKRSVLNGDSYNLVEWDGLNTQGFINGNTGVFTLGSSGTGLNCCTGFIAVDSSLPLVLVSVANPLIGVQFNCVEYDKNRNFIQTTYREVANFVVTLNSNTRFVRFSFNNTQANFNKTDIYQMGSVSGLLEQKTYWRNGSLGNAGSTLAIASRDIIPNCGATSFAMVVNKALPTGYKYRFQISTYTVENGTTTANAGNRITRDMTIVTTDNFAVFSLKDGSVGFGVSLYMLDDNDDFVPMSITSFDVNDISVLRYYEASYESSNYAVDASFNKRSVTLTRLGTLSGRQAFCKYNGNYYSIVEGSLYEQNSAFEVLSTTPINVGHGNALQLGLGGKAYASGWDDNRVYVVDLATKTVVNTIVLPTTGYTTCAVDDMNGLIYIFQRDSYPETEEYYRFITYDYANEQILSTKWTTRPFGAMQACDFVDGRIFVVNGLGTSDVPNGYRIYNTAGDVIGSYVLNTLSAEPEGVFVDRDNFDLYISDVGNNLYKVD